MLVNCRSVALSYCLTLNVTGASIRSIEVGATPKSILSFWLAELVILILPFVKTGMLSSQPQVKAPENCLRGRAELAGDCRRAIRVFEK